jgi:hydroxyacylglutathione hydrolase
LGPIENNTYLLWDDASRQAVVIDPSFEPSPLVDFIQDNQLLLIGIWLTHAHFDHTAGINDLLNSLQIDVPIWLHPDDLDLYKNNGLSTFFGFEMPALPAKTNLLNDGQLLLIGDFQVELHHTPGHCPGHVIFYAPGISTAFTGDLIFRNGVGRTDLPGSNQDDLEKSIQIHIFNLPGETILLSGHGSETTVKEEKSNNPYL